MVESLSAKEIVHYPKGGKSYFYVINQTVIIVDEGICNCISEEEAFPYTLITDKQNYYMHRYEKVFRFLAEDMEKIEEEVRNTKINTEVDFTIRVANREDNADASPLELLFEKNFTNVYGMNALKYLWKEYGVSYHHPQIIRVERYRKQLCKQNTCTQWGIKLYRFSTEDCQFENRIEDDIRNFFGGDVSQFQENGLLIDRKVELYDHQADFQRVKNQVLEDIQNYYKEMGA